MGAIVGPLDFYCLIQSEVFEGISEDKILFLGSLRRKSMLVGVNVTWYLGTPKILIFLFQGVELKTYETNL